MPEFVHLLDAQTTYSETENFYFTPTGKLRTPNLQPIPVKEYYSGDTLYRFFHKSLI